MQVSNGTGQGSEYRVGSNSGGSRAQDTGDLKSGEAVKYVSGSLAPGASEYFSMDETVYLEFWMGEKMVASISFSKDPGQVMLVDKEGSFSIAVLGEKSAAA
jgi:hypothetical protein